MYTQELLEVARYRPQRRHRRPAQRKRGDYMWCPICGDAYRQQTTCIHQHVEIALLPFPNQAAVSAAMAIGGARAVRDMARSLVIEWRREHGYRAGARNQESTANDHQERVDRPGRLRDEGSDW